MRQAAVDVCYLLSPLHMMDTTPTQEKCYTNDKTRLKNIASWTPKVGGKRGIVGSGREQRWW